MQFIWVDWCDLAGDLYKIPAILDDLGMLGPNLDMSLQHCDIRTAETCDMLR